MITASGTHTFLESLVAAIEEASEYNSQDQVPPAAVLWPDGERQWESLLPALRNQLPVFALGEYSPDENTGTRLLAQVHHCTHNSSPKSSGWSGAGPLSSRTQQKRIQGHGIMSTRTATACGIAVPRNPLVPKTTEKTGP